MDTKELAYQIANFLGKDYYNYFQNVEFPEWAFIIKQFLETDVSIDSLREIGNKVYSFSATTKIRKGEKNHTVITHSTCIIKGKAFVSPYKDKVSKETRVEVKHIIIDSISEPQKTEL